MALLIQRAFVNVVAGAKSAVSIPNDPLHPLRKAFSGSKSPNLIPSALPEAAAGAKTLISIPKASPNAAAGYCRVALSTKRPAFVDKLWLRTVLSTNWPFFVDISNTYQPLREHIVDYVKNGPKSLKKNCGNFTAENRKSCG